MSTLFSEYFRIYFPQIRNPRFFGGARGDYVLLSVKRIVETAKDKKISEQIICRAINAHKSKVYDWKKGKSSPTNEELAIVAELLDVSTDYILGVTDNPTKKEPTQNNELTPARHKALQEIASLIDAIPEDKLDAALAGFRSIVDVAK